MTLLYATTIFFQITLLVYRQLIVLVSLYPFNDLERYAIRYKVPEIIVNSLFMILPPIGYIWHIKLLMIYAILFYPLDVMGAIFIWWIPYLFGPGFGHRKLFQELFSRTVRVLPPINGRPAPDLQHCILHAIALITTILTVISFLQVYNA